MGNYSSCSCTLSPYPGNHRRGAKVILPDGSIRHLDHQTNAAELMLDVPGHFLVNSCSMRVGRRFSPLSADEDLEMGNVYIMLPMARVHSRVTVGDTGRVLIAANKAVRRASGGRVRILPHSTKVSSEPSRDRCTSPGRRLELGEAGDNMVTELSYRLSMCRSRRPVLETIAEETVYSRS